MTSRRAPLLRRNSRAAVLALVAAGGIALALLLWRGDGRGTDAGGAGPAPSGGPDATGTPLEPAADGADERAATDTRWTRAVPAFEERLVGQVLDDAGRPAAGAELWMRAGSFPPRAVGACDADGRFDVAVTLDRVPQGLYLAEPWVLKDPVAGVGVGYRTVVMVDEEPWGEPRTMYAARRLAITGVVVHDGGPVAGLDVQWRTQRWSLGVRDPEHHDAHAARTDARGAFALDGPARALVLPGLALHVESVRFEPLVEPVEPAPGVVSFDGVELRVLTRRDHLVGRVVDEEGAPLEAQVALGPRMTRSLRHTGEFALDLAGVAPGDDPLVAAAAGYAPAVLPDVGRELVRRGGRHPSIEIALSPAGRVVGRVLTHEGTPALEARVSVSAAAELFGQYAEEVASRTGRLTQEVSAEGAFELDGLAHRAYTVVAVDPLSLAHVELEVEPWTDAAEDGARAVELVLPPPNRRAVRGTARHPDGSPAAGLTVYAFVELPGRPDRDHRFTRAGDVAADGSFVLDDLPRQDLLICASDATYPREAPLPAEAREVHLVVQRLCPVVIEWPADAEPPDRGHALDAQGTEIELFQSRVSAFVESARLAFASPRAGVDGFREEEVWVPEGATTLVLSRAGAETLRLGIAPEPERKTRARP